MPFLANDRQFVNQARKQIPKIHGVFRGKHDQG